MEPHGPTALGSALQRLRTAPRILALCGFPALPLALVPGHPLVHGLANIRHAGFPGSLGGGIELGDPVEAGADGDGDIIGLMPIGFHGHSSSSPSVLSGDTTVKENIFSKKAAKDCVWRHHMVK